MEQNHRVYYMTRGSHTHLNFSGLAHYFSPHGASNLYSHSIFKHEHSGINLVSDQYLFFYLFIKNLVLVGKKGTTVCWEACWPLVPDEAGSHIRATSHRLRELGQTSGHCVQNEEMTASQSVAVLMS